MKQTENTFSLETWDHIFESLNFPELFQISVTSLTFYVAVRAHLSHRLRILLKEFVANVYKFRCLMWNSDVVISGSRALRFVMPSLSPAWTLPPTEIHLFAPMNREDQVLGHLLGVEGYRLCSWRDNPSFPPSIQIRDAPPISVMSQGIARVVAVYHPERQRHIDIIVSDTPSPLTAIFAYHSTPVMNWLSAHSATVAYPRMTFVGRGLIVGSNFAGTSTLGSRRAQNSLVKCQIRRCITFARDPSRWDGTHECGTRHNCLQIIRHSNDLGTAFMSFKPGGAPWIVKRGQGHRRDVKVGAIWRLGGKMCRLGRDGYQQYGDGTRPFCVAVPDLTRPWRKVR